MQKNVFIFFCWIIRKKKRLKVTAIEMKLVRFEMAQIIIEKWEKKSSIDMKSWEYNGIIRLCYK